MSTSFIRIGLFSSRLWDKEDRGEASDRLRSEEDEEADEELNDVFVMDHGSTFLFCASFDKTPQWLANRPFIVYGLF